MLDGACDLARSGWKVFPCVPRGDRAKAPYTDNGFHDATDDPGQIKRWWTRWPDAMIGAPVPNSVLVLDIDPRHGGSRDVLELLAGPLPITLTVWSGRNDGGCHLYLQRPAGPMTSTRLMTIGIDLKINGYCIVPPSIHPATGQPYRWEQHPVSAMTYRLRELLIPPPKPIFRRNGNAPAAGLLRAVAEAPEGNRNNSLYWAACRAVEDGILAQIEDQLLAAAISAGESETEARRTVASARRTVQ
jgi:hypothetical protein